MSTHVPKEHDSIKKVPGGHMYGDVLSPMEEDFRPGSDHEGDGKRITNGVPGYPKGSEREAAETTFYEGGNFGKFKRD